MKQRIIKISFLISLILLLSFSLIPIPNLNTTLRHEINDEALNFQLTNIEYSNATVISDGFNNVYWNDLESYNPDIAVDNNGTIHVVWYDNTDGVWGVDYEIMYVCYTETSGWSNITLISDGYEDIYWNDGHSQFPQIAVDRNDNVHIVYFYKKPIFINKT